jgi:hypothetical protein
MTTVRAGLLAALDSFSASMAVFMSRTSGTRPVCFSTVRSMLAPLIPSVVFGCVFRLRYSLPICHLSDDVAHQTRERRTGTARYGDWFALFRWVMLESCGSRERRLPDATISINEYMSAK